MQLLDLVYTIIYHRSTFVSISFGTADFGATEQAKREVTRFLMYLVHSFSSSGSGSA